MKKIISLLFVLLLLFSLCSCGAAEEAYEASSPSFYSKNSLSSSASSDAVSLSGSGEFSVYEESPSLDAEGTANEDAAGQKIIYRVYLELETKNYDAALSQIISQAEVYGGYISERSEYAGNSSRSVTLTVRIPSASLSAYTDSVSRDCNVLSNRLTTEDITDTYYNVKSRMESLVEQEKRLNTLLEKADTLEYLLKIEDELSEVRSEINELNYRIQLYDKAVDYSYVNISLNEVVEYQPTEELTFLQKIGEAFADGFSALGTVWEWIAIALSWLIPFLAPALIVTAVVLFLVFHRRKASKKSDENK